MDNAILNNALPIIENALMEDLDFSGDITTQAISHKAEKADARIIAKQSGIHF